MKKIAISKSRFGELKINQSYKFSSDQRSYEVEIRFRKERGPKKRKLSTSDYNSPEHGTGKIL